MANNYGFTIDDYEEFEECFTGVCTKCGATRGCCESDAEDYPCEECGEDSVQGAGNLLIDGFFNEED